MNARVEHLLVGVHPGERGEERRVDVERRRCVVEENVCEHAHVAVEADKLELVVGERVEDAALVGFSALAVVALHDLARHAVVGRPVEDRGVGVVRDDDGEPRAAGSPGVEVAEVPAAVARQAS